MSKKRRRDRTTIDGELVEIYEDLAHENEDIRIKAAQTLLSRLASEREASRTQLVTDVLIRLIRGLCSGRRTARLGFSIALTEFLVQTRNSSKDEAHAEVDVQDIIGALIKHSTPSGNVSGQEVRDHNFGRLFGAEALIHSGILFSTGAGGEGWSQVVEIICELAEQKAQLREECGWVLFRAVQNLSVHANNHQRIKHVLNSLDLHGLSKTPEGVAIWLASQSTLQEQLPPAIWEYNDPLCRTEKPIIAKVMTEAFAAEINQEEHNAVINKKRNWSPKLHFAWDVVLSTLISEQQSETQQNLSSERLSLKEFWDEVVDNGLFSKTASDQRKFWGFVVFQRILQSGPADVLPTIFSTNLIRCFMNHLSSSGRYLHRVAQSALKSIFARTKREPSTTTIVLSSLLRLPSKPFNFDQATKTKTVEKLLSKVEDSALLGLIPLFSHLLASPNTEDSVAAAASRRMVADQMVSVIRSKQNKVGPKTNESAGLTAFVREVLSLFAEHAYFVREAESSAREHNIHPAITPSSREMFRSRIFSCMTHILSKFAQPAIFSYELVMYIRSMSQEASNLRFLFKADDAIKKIIDKAFATLDKIHSKRVSSTDSRERLLSVFQLLFSLTVLQVFNGETEAVKVLEELKASYSQLLKHKHKIEQGNSDALVEILLSFVSRPSLLFRHLAQQVFSTCTSDISHHGLQSILRVCAPALSDMPYIQYLLTKDKVLETTESLAGQEEIFVVEDEGKGAESEDHSSDVSDFGMVEAHVISNSSTRLSDEDDAYSHESADEELAQFDSKLALALHRRPATDGLSTSDSDRCSSEDMNDEQMEALDEHIAKIFRERKIQVSRKTRNKDAVEAILNFKCRVLELLGIYIKHQHMNALAFELLNPLLTVVRTTKGPLVSSKACDVIRDFSKICTSKSQPRISDSKAIMELLRNVHRQASQHGSKAYGTACSQASLLLVKVLMTHNRDNLEVIEALYGQTHLGFMRNPSASHVRASFFTEWLDWSVTARNSKLYVP